MANYSDLIFSQSGATASAVLGLGINQSSLGITASSLGIGNAEDRIFKEVTDGSRKPYAIPSITTMNNRANSWGYNWSNAEAWTNYYNYLTGTQTADCERAFWFGLGTNNRNNTLSYSAQEMGQTGYLDWAKNSVIGGERVHIAVGNNTGYAPIRSRVMFIRNHHPSTTKTITMYGHYSNYWSSGYDGSGVAIGTPNVSGSYASTTLINWSVPANRTGGNSNYTWSWNVSIPPKTTVAVLQTSSIYYWQSGYVYWWLDINKFYSLDSTFSDPWIQPDLKMTQAAYLYNDLNNEYNVQNSHRIWQTTATMFGDR